MDRSLPRPVHAVGGRSLPQTGKSVQWALQSTARRGEVRVGGTVKHVAGVQQVDPTEPPSEELRSSVSHISLVHPPDGDSELGSSLFTRRWDSCLNLLKSSGSSRLIWAQTYKQTLKSSSRTQKDGWSCQKRPSLMQLLTLNRLSLWWHHRHHYYYHYYVTTWASA